MTRNEWIAETARMYRVHGRWGESLGCLETFSTAGAIDAAVRDADVLEAANVAPWKDASPALTDTAAKVVEAAIKALNDEDDDGKLWDAVRAHLAAKQGGAS